MKIQIMSDTHFEFHRDRGTGFIRTLNPVQEIDVLIHAGDMCPAHMLENKVKALCDKFPNVVYVTGNHEYYHSSPKHVHGLLGDLKVRIPNFHWLDKEVVEIKDSATDKLIKFAGATLWFRDTSAARALTNQINDFTYIQNFVPWVYEENEKALDFFTNACRDVNIVVTHHLPRAKSVMERYKGSPMNCYFLCDVGDSLGHSDLWVHGHAHGNVDFQEGGTRVICNPHGYGCENPKFDNYKVIEL
tara:strand:+ start:5897 stop:6631 length:735 start_codon:yes stop_codon:yes gene_type:complete